MEPLQGKPDADGALVRQLRAELSERRLVEAELYSLGSALERLLAESRAALAQAREELGLERGKRAADRRESKLLGEELVRKNDALATVCQELKSFGYAVSHDLRAPLRHMLGFSGALAEHLENELDPTAQSYLACIVRAGGKMEAMFEALLNLSRVSRQELNLARVDLSRMARECAESLQNSAPERRAAFQIGEHLSAQADAALLRIALGNLFENAWKYTSKKEMTRIEFNRKQEGDSTVFYLRDNGAGFDTRYADKLFAPFQRMHVESEYGGRGMGLATAQRIIHRHGGRIWADARIDAGATFSFTLAEQHRDGTFGAVPNHLE